LADSKLKNFIIVPNNEPLIPRSGKERGVVYATKLDKLSEIFDDPKTLNKLKEAIDSPDPDALGKMLDSVPGGADIKKLFVATTAGSGVTGIAALALKTASNSLDYAVSAAEGAVAGLEQAVGINIPESLGGLAGEIVKLTVTLDDLQKDVGRTTGMFTHLGANVQGIARQFRDLGVTYERTAKAMIALDKGFSQLNTTTRAQQYTLLRFTHQMENLGVSADVTGKSLEVFARGTFSTQESAIRATKSIIQFSREIRYKGGPAQMAADIMAIGPMLNKYGSATEATLKQMAVQARKTGLEMKQIFDVSDQMDTFEDASEMVGRLNANFGLGLNAVTLMQANEAERRQIVVDRFQSMYGTFDNLDRRQKQTMGQVLGFGKNIQDTRKYFQEQGMEVSGGGLGFDQAAQAATKFAETAQAANEELITRSIGEGGVAQAVQDTVHSLGDFNSALAYSTLMMNLGLGKEVAGVFPGGRLFSQGLRATKAGIALGKGFSGPSSAPAFGAPMLGAAAGVPFATSMGVPTGQGNYTSPASLPGMGRVPGSPGMGNNPPRANLPYPNAPNEVAGSSFLMNTGMVGLDYAMGTYGAPFIAKLAGESPTLYQRLRLGKASPMELNKELQRLSSKAAKASNRLVYDINTRKVSGVGGGRFRNVGFDHTRATARVSDDAAKGVATLIEEGGKSSAKSLAKSGVKTFGKRVVPIIGDVAFGVMEAEADIAAGGSAGMAYANEAAGAAGGIGGMFVGAKGGAALGGLIGSVVPGLGTAIGAGVGGLIGAIGGAFYGEQAGEAAFQGVTGHKTQAQKVEINNQARAKQQKAMTNAMQNFHNKNLGPQASADGVKGKLDANLHFHLPNGDVKEVKTQLEATFSPLGTRNRNRANDRPSAINNISVTTV